MLQKQLYHGTQRPALEGFEEAIVIVAAGTKQMRC